MPTFVFTLCLEPPRRRVLGRHAFDRPLGEGDVVHTADGEAWVVRRLFRSEDDLTNEGVAYCAPLDRLAVTEDDPPAGEVVR